MLSRLLTFLCLVVLSPVSFAQKSETAPEAVPESCPVTRPAGNSFVAPSPYPAQAPEGSFWFGTDRLWTILRTDATWPRTEKTFWWRREWLPYKSDIPEREGSRLKVTARRLDNPSPPAKIARGLGGYREDWQSFLVGGIDFPTSGCWEVSAHYENDDLTFVVWVAK